MRDDQTWQSDIYLQYMFAYMCSLYASSSRPSVMMTSLQAHHHHHHHHHHLVLLCVYLHLLFFIRCCVQPLVTVSLSFHWHYHYWYFTIQYNKQESHAIAGRTARCCCNFWCMCLETNPIPIPPEFWGRSRWTRLLSLGSARAETLN